MFLVGAVAVAVLGLANHQSGSAATLEARWSIYGRASTGGFEPGTTPVDAPGSGAGYEIVSFAATGLADGLAGYLYGGPDLPVENGGPMPAIVSCTASFTITSIELTVSGAYPYAGCVFFPGVTNTGDAAIRVDLGPLTADAAVTCTAPGCQRTDVELLAGGLAGDEDILCRVEGGTFERVAGSVFALSPGATVACPLFVVVLQPAKENATYVVEITPPPVSEPPDTQVLDEPPPGPPTGRVDQPPVVDVAPPPVEDPDETEPVEPVAGERTAGPAPTPVAPATGSAVLVQGGSGGGSAGLAGVLLLAAAVLALAGLSWRQR
jgi:hypothetical protein